MSEQQMNDSTFSRLFILMIIAMSILAIVLGVLASIASSDVNSRLDERSDRENTQAVAARIAPVGTFSAETVDAPANTLQSVVLTAQQVYDSSCAACHANGVLNSPIIGDTAAWSERLKKGIETLYSNAIGGIGSMPAKGGNGSLTDESVKEAVDYIIEQSQ